MNPKSKLKIRSEQKDLALEEVTQMEDASPADIVAILREAEASGLSEKSFEEVYDDIFEQYFGREKLIEARQARQTG